MSSLSYPAHEGLQVSPSRGSEVTTLETLSESFIQKPPLTGEPGDTEPTHSTATICGLKKRTFWITLFPCLILLSGAIGVGIGAAIWKATMTSRSSASTLASTSSTTMKTSSTSTFASSTLASSTLVSSTLASSTTTSSEATFPTSGLLALDCPALNTISYSTIPSASARNYTFTIYCNVNYVGNDLGPVNALTVSDCMDACAKYDEAPPGSQQCEGVIFNSNLTLALQYGGNCFLKSNVSDKVLGEILDIAAGAVLESVVNI